MKPISFDPKSDLTFAVLSDLHMTHRGEGLQKLYQHLDLYSRAVGRLDAHLFTGDIVYQINVSGGGTYDRVHEAPYVYLDMAIEKYAKDIPVIYVNGNHEFPQHNPDPTLHAESRAMMEKHGYPLRQHTEIRGYHFITIPLWSYQEEIRPEDEAWAMTEIRRALRASGDKPVFVAYHVPIDGTVVGATQQRFSDKFRAFLLSSRRIINICGHLHTAIEHPLSIWQKAGGSTVVHAPMSGVGNVNVKGSVGNVLSVYQSRSFFVEVTGTKVLFHKVDNLTESEIGEPWVVDVAGKQYYTEIRKTRAKKPAFEKGVKVDAMQAPGGVFFRFPKAKCELTEGNDDREVPEYRFTFTKKGKTTPALTLTKPSDFYASYPGDTFEAIVPAKLPAGIYTVAITPVSFFGKEGKAVSVRVKLGDYVPAIRDAEKRGFDAFWLV